MPKTFKFVKNIFHNLRAAQTSLVHNTNFTALGATSLHRNFTTQKKEQTCKILPCAFALSSYYKVFLFFDIRKSWLCFSVPFHGFIPHGKGAHPRSAVAVQGAVNDHFFTRFRMFRHAQHLVFITLEMFVFS